MIDINSEFYDSLLDFFGSDSNIKIKDFLTCTDNFDIIIGNPPFNCEGIKRFLHKKT